MRQQNTKQLILNCAIDKFAEKGYANVSMREIADAVGIRAASIYNHFASKSDIMDAIMELYQQKSFQILSFDQREDVVEFAKDKSFDELMETLFYVPYRPEDSDRVRKILRILTVEQYTLPQATRFASEQAIVNSVILMHTLLDTLVADGKLPQSVNTLFAAELIIRISFAFVHQYTHGQNGEDGPDSMSMNAMLSRVFALMKKGLI